MVKFNIFILATVVVLLLILFLLKKVWRGKTRGEYLVDIMKTQDPELYKLLQDVSNECDATLEATVFTHYALVYNAEESNNSELACEQFFMLVNDLYSSFTKGLLAIKVSSPQQLDTIASKLAEKNIVKLSDNFSFSHLESAFKQS